MYTREILQDIHERAHRNLAALLAHCRGLGSDEIDREWPGFGYPTVRLQIHHAIGAENYWIGVLEGRIDAEDDSPDYPTIASLETYRARVFGATEAYLRRATIEDLNTARPMATWGKKTRVLAPAHVVLRTVTHLYHHQGQVLAMCRLAGNPGAGLDFPID